MHPQSSPADCDWRLRVQLTEGLRSGRRTSSGARHLGQIEWMVESKRIGSDATVSYDGRTVYAYGSTAAGLHSADRAIRHALIADGRTAQISAYRWDEPSGSWLEFDPLLPPGYEPASVAPAVPPRTVTRTTQASAGRLVSEAYRKDIEAYTQLYDIDCRIASSQGLFRTRFEITVSGPEDQVRDTLEYIRKLAKSSSKVDPGLIPYGGL